MLRSASDFGISHQDWNAAKEQARTAMIERAKVQGYLTYSELVAKISAVKFNTLDTRLFHLLGEISTEEFEARRGMLTAVVVRSDNMMPGSGFFELAQSLKLDTRDNTKFWLEQLEMVYASWAGAKRKNSN